MTKMNFAMGQAVDLKVDPTVCQNPSDCAQGPINANNEQNNAVKILTGGVLKKYRKFKGGVKFREPQPPADIMKLNLYHWAPKQQIPMIIIWK